MIQAVQEYTDAMEAAEQAYQSAEQTRTDARNEAWTELGECDNAFVAWAVEQVNENGSYKRETLAILMALPENPVAQDVRDAARAAGYANSPAINEAISRAVQAGVLSEGDQPTTEAPRQDAAAGGQARRRFLDRVRSQVGPHAVSDVEQALNEILAEEAADHVRRNTN